jgi:hypothetical protein
VPHGVVFNFLYPKIGEKGCGGRRNVLGSGVGAVLIHYSISEALWLATAISAVCGIVLFRSGPTPDKR